MKNTNTSDDILNIIKWLNENISELSDARYAHEKIIPETFDSYVHKVKNNCIYFNANKFLFLTVKTLDKKLPYTLCVRSFINYKAPNLCSFENVISDYAPADNSYTFNKCTKLNFKELNKKDIRTTLWVHPFANLDSENFFFEAINFLAVLAPDGLRPSLTSWWDGPGIKIATSIEN